MIMSRLSSLFYCESGCGVSRTESCVTVNIFCEKSAVEMGCKEIEIIHRLFLVIAMYCQASSMNLTNDVYMNKVVNISCTSVYFEP